MGFCASTLDLKEASGLVFPGRQPMIVTMEQADVLHVFAKDEIGKTIYCLLKCGHDYDNYAVSYNY